MAGRQIRLGILGAGDVVRSLHLPVLRAIHDVDVTWICDDDLQRAKSAAKIYGVGVACSSLEECSAQVDVVLVAIPVGSRRSALETIIARKQHAFCEKPFAASLEEHSWILSRARAAGVQLGAALVRRVYGSTLLAKSVLATGVLGAVQAVSAGEGSRIQRTGREDDWYQASPTASGGGVLMEAGPHVVDQIMTICGVRAFNVESCEQAMSDDLEFESVARGTLELVSGDRPRFRLDVSRLRDVYNGIVIRGERGELRIGLSVDSPVEMAGRADGSSVRLPAPGPTDAVSAFADEWRGFLARCRDGGGSNDEATGLLTTAFIDACYTLARAAR